ncbi:MAG: WxcM-like domain-containing protein [Victivallaceae bacterium]|nr:WxcM-like domain-containing protein [Victivallaceae bacterium]
MKEGLIYMDESLRYFRHPESIVEPGAAIGDGTRVWAWSHILSGAVVGSDCNLCDHTFVEGGAVVGNRVTVKCGVYIWNGVTVEDDVFIGPSAAFTNDKFPRSGVHCESCGKTRICKGVSIGANSTILPVTVGAYAMIGAGSVVTKNVPPYAIAAGNPARIIGYVDTVNMRDGVAASGSVSVAVSATGAKLIAIPGFSDLRGDLGVIELEKFLPFPVRRLFYTYGVQSPGVRGEHAHKKCEQFLVALNGSLHVIVDDSEHREEFVLDTPREGLHLPAGCWGVQYKHTADCVLLVLASRKYEADDYIRDYEDFLKYRGK